MLVVCAPDAVAAETQKTTHSQVRGMSGCEYALVVGGAESSQENRSA
jgi:hypothetical protein